MKLTFLFLLTGFTIAIAQVPTLDVSGSSVGGYGSVKFNNPSELGQKSVNNLEYSEVRGRCYWGNEWTPALLTLKGGNFVKMPKVKLNLFTNDIHYIDKNGSELVAQSGLVKRMILYSNRDTLEIIAIFQSLANKASDYKEAFFEILNEGKIQLLKKTTVNLSKQDYDPSVGKAEYKFISSTDYFIKDDNKVTIFKKFSKTALFSMINPSNESEKWLVSNENKLKTEADVIAFLNFSNKEESR